MLVECEHGCGRCCCYSVLVEYQTPSTTLEKQVVVLNMLLISVPAKVIGRGKYRAMNKCRKSNVDRGWVNPSWSRIPNSILIRDRKDGGYEVDLISVRSPGGLGWCIDHSFQMRIVNRVQQSVFTLIKTSPDPSPQGLRVTLHKRALFSCAAAAGLLHPPIAPIPPGRTAHGRSLRRTCSDMMNSWRKRRFTKRTRGLLCSAQIFACGFIRP